LEHASRPVEEFIENRLGGYAEHRNQPQANRVSHMSKYLHFGHISPVSSRSEYRTPAPLGRTRLLRGRDSQIGSRVA
jgi:deoxyribodipyrimidine photolyase